MQVNLGGVVHLSTVDWCGMASMVIFLRRCPLRCPHCQNFNLQEGYSPVALSQVASEIRRTRSLGWRNAASDQTTLEEALSMTTAKPFVSALVFSGGEPLMQPKQVATLARLAKGLGLNVGLETSGYYPERISKLLKEKLVDKIFLDVKAPLREPEYSIATGREGTASMVFESLRICMKSGILLDIRTTIFPDMPSPSELLEIAEMLSALKAEFPDNKLEYMVLQQGRPREKEFEPVSSDCLKALARSIGDLVEVKIRSPPKLTIDNAIDYDAPFARGRRVED